MNVFTNTLAAAVLAAFAGAHAHGLWIAPAKAGTYGIHYGEVGDNEREKKDKIEGFGLPEAFDAQGNALKVTLEDDGFYVASKTPITASFVNGPIYGEGENATRYQSWLRFAPDLKTAGTPRADFPLDIVPVGGNKSAFKLVKDGAPYAGAWAEVTAPNGWAKWFEADSSGVLTIKAPWPGLYVIHVKSEEKAAGTQGGKAFARNHRSAYLSVIKR